MSENDDVKEARRLVDEFAADPTSLVKCAELGRWASSGGVARLLSKIEEMEKERTAFYATVERLGLAEMIECDDDDNTTSTWVNGRAEYAERTAADKAAEVEKLREALAPHYTRSGHGIVDAVCTMFRGGTFILGDGDALTPVQEAYIKYRAALSPPPTDSTTFPTSSVPGNHLLSGPEEG